MAQPVGAQVAVKGKIIHTMEGESITDGTILLRDGKIASIGLSSDITVPDDFEVLEAEVVTPGLIDAHSIVGLTGMLNQDEDQDPFPGLILDACSRMNSPIRGQIFSRHRRPLKMP